MKAAGRRKFIIMAGRAACGLALGAVAYRVVGKHFTEDEAGPRTRHAWQIDSDKCKGCDLCKTMCVRKPSAVKAVNDQKKCSFCVVCYGHITNRHIDSDKIMSEGKRVCPWDAVIRVDYSGRPDGYFIYEIDDDKCDGCGKCVELCSKKGTKSMFLIIRPDLCLNCNTCNIAVHCPEKAVDKVFIGPEDDFKGIWELEREDSGDTSFDFSGRKEQG
ncbi:MAG: 4Fe-4S dicluster domain-containing protein [Bacteroidota bacterium]